MKSQLFFLAFIYICTFRLSVFGENNFLMATPEGIEIADSIPLDTMGAFFNEKLFSFKSNNAELSKALELFCKSNGFNLSAPSIDKTLVNLNENRVPLEKIMYSFLVGTPYSWSIQNNTIYIKYRNNSTNERRSQLVVQGSNEERFFTINYPRLKRSGQGASSAMISSTSSGQAGSISLSTEDQLLFWQELEDQLKIILSDNAKIVVNKLSGVIYVKDTPDRLNAAEKYLAAICNASIRQVEITARIYEVTLDDDQSLGVDWTRIFDQISFDSIMQSFDITGITSYSGSAFKASTITADINIDNKIFAIVKALKEQGDVKTISQPRVITMNNQPALVKVGTDLPVFSTSVTQNPTTGQRDEQEKISTITVGVVLSVTPQISEDDWITLEINPLISDYISEKVSRNGSTAPIVDVKQSSALVRIKDRQTVRISGLIQNKKTKLERRIPLLGDIPLLGTLFKWKYSTEQQKELVIFISPRIIY